MQMRSHLEAGLGPTGTEVKTSSFSWTQSSLPWPHCSLASADIDCFNALGTFHGFPGGYLQTLITSGPHCCLDGLCLHPLDLPGVSPLCPLNLVH